MRMDCAAAPASIARETLATIAATLATLLICAGCWTWYALRSNELQEESHHLVVRGEERAILGGRTVDDSGVAAPNYEWIAVNRSSSYGPTYRLVLRRSGGAEFSGNDRSHLEGAYFGHVNWFDYGRLCQLLDALRFSEMLDHYETRSTDGETWTITARADQRTKTVREYDHVGPLELWAIQQSIEGVRGRIEWEKQAAAR
jgi:hypothetical protein